MSDSHLALPEVDASLEALEATDFQPFRVLSDMPMAMTAHVVYRAIDKHRPATTSRKAIKLIREGLGFGGLLMSDDLSMKALSGDFTTRAKASLRAGCDVVLHCNGDMDGDEGGDRRNGPSSRSRQTPGRRRHGAPCRTPEPFDEAEARARFNDAFHGLNAPAGTKG